MWIVWIYFFLSSSGALGEEEISSDELFCNSFQGFEKGSVEDPTHRFKFLPFDATYKISRNSPIYLPCLFRNLAGNDIDIVWKKGENVICDADNFICKNNTGPKDKSKHSLINDTIICAFLEQPGQHLIIGNAQHEDAGEYTCEIKSSPPQVLTKIKLEVLDTEFSIANQTFTVTEGDSVTLPCEVKDIGDEYVPIWIFNYGTDHRFFYNGYDFPYSEPTLKLVEGKKYYLQVQNITQRLAGDYSCVLNTMPRKLLTHKVIVKKVTPEPKGIKPMFSTGTSQ